MKAEAEVMPPEAVVNGATIDMDGIKEPPGEGRRYELTAEEQAYFKERQGYIDRTKNSMQGAFEMMLIKRGLKAEKGFVLLDDCSAIVEQV